MVWNHRFPYHHHHHRLPSTTIMNFRNPWFLSRYWLFLTAAPTQVITLMAQIIIITDTHHQNHHGSHHFFWFQPTISQYWLFLANPRGGFTAVTEVITAPLMVSPSPNLSTRRSITNIDLILKILQIIITMVKLHHLSTYHGFHSILKFKPNNNNILSWSPPTWLDWQVPIRDRW